jgi:hypothetical protein
MGGRANTLRDAVITSDGEPGDGFVLPHLFFSLSSKNVAVLQAA